MGAVETTDTDTEQRTRLLEGLAASIREKGLAQTQLTDIVRHAKASRRTFYKHFADKDAAFVELMRLIGETTRAHVVAAVDPAADWETQVDQAVDAYLAALAAEPQLRLTFASPSLGEKVVRAQRQAIEEFAEMVQELVAGEAFRTAAIAPITRERAYMLVGGLHLTLVRAATRDEDPAPLHAEFKAVFKAVLAA